MLQMQQTAQRAGVDEIVVQPADLTPGVAGRRLLLGLELSHFGVQPARR